MKVEGTKQQQQPQQQQNQKQGRPRPLLPPASTWLKRIPHPSQLKAPTQVYLRYDVVHRNDTMCTAIRLAFTVHGSCLPTHSPTGIPMLTCSPLPCQGRGTDGPFKTVRGVTAKGSTSDEVA